MTSEKFRKKTLRDAPAGWNRQLALAWVEGYNKALADYDERFREELTKQ